MHCQIKDCKVEYKVRIPFDPKPEDELIIFIKNQYTHPLEELDSIPHYGVKENVKRLIKPMLNNKVKPSKIQKVLEEYTKEGVIEEKDLPTASQIPNLRRNLKKQDNQLETLGEFTKLVEELALNSGEDSSSLIIGKNLSTEDFCLVFFKQKPLKKYYFTSWKL